jgi:hypothetical protein
MGDTEWLEDCAAICCGRHFAEEVRCVFFEGGMYVKMCRACYERDYPGYQYEELEHV